MALGQENFDVIGIHSRGNSALAVQYFQAAQQVGDGNGAFYGSGVNAAKNLGVTIDINNGAGLKAGGVAIAEKQ